MRSLITPEGKFLSNLTNQESRNLLRSYCEEGQKSRMRGNNAVLPTGFKIRVEPVWGSAVLQDLRDDVNYYNGMSKPFAKK